MKKKKNEDEEHLELVLDKYRDALRELENDDQKFDLELESICLANIAKIKYKFMQHHYKIPILKEIHELSQESVRRAMTLVNIQHKNVENTNWYKEIKKIDTDIMEILLLEEEKLAGGFQLKIKKENRAIFDELEEQFKKDNFEIIKFILKKYPPLNYEEPVPAPPVGQNIIQQNNSIESKWQENKKNFVSDLCIKYALDNYSKETDEEKLKYTIISVISSKVNSIYNEIK